MYQINLNKRFNSYQFWNLKHWHIFRPKLLWESNQHEVWYFSVVGDVVSVRGSQDALMDLVLFMFYGYKLTKRCVFSSV